MSDFGSRKPIHFQNPDLAKALKSSSYESFQPHRAHPTTYKEMEDRPGVEMGSVVRRYPDGRLDYEWVKQNVLEALHHLQLGTVPVNGTQQALLQLVFPTRVRFMDPQQAEIQTQLSESEKNALKMLVDASLKEQENWNAGFGGGSVEGRSVTKVH